MDQGMLVGMTQPEGRLADHLAGIGDPQRPTALDDLRQVHPINVFHDEEVRPLVAAGVHGPNNVGMLELAHGLHFPIEAGYQLRILHGGGREDFKGHELVEFRVQGLVDRTHAAMAQLFQKPVFAELTQFGNAARCLGRRFGRRRVGRRGRLRLQGANPLQDMAAFALVDKRFLVGHLTEHAQDGVALLFE
jgi:hypothetical protein